MTSTDESAASRRALTTWPLTGSAEFDRLPATWRARTAQVLAADFQRHVCQAWFPRTVDSAAGGFLCDFDRRWRPIGRQDRTLEFQARQTRSAARIGRAFPKQASWVEVSQHGFRYLMEVMHDHVEGGWYNAVNRAGDPLIGGSKHAHGTAYLIGGLASLHRLTGDPDVLEAAVEAFEWLEDTLHDPVQGGYFGWATREGRPIRSVEDLPPEIADMRVDPLGHGIGFKDANVHSDLLDAFTQLYAAWPNERLRSRMAEVFELVTRRFVTAAGSMHYLAYSDFTPAPTLERYGDPSQTAPRLIVAGAMLGAGSDDILSLVRRMSDHVAEVAWDSERGGFRDAGPSAAPFHLAGHSMSLPTRSWWVQTEAMRTTLLVAAISDDPEPYLRRFDAALEFTRRELLDHRHAGWYAAALSDQPRWPPRPHRSRRHKGNIWKDASHETDFYLAALRILGGVEADAALPGSPDAAH